MAKRDFKQERVHQEFIRFLDIKYPDVKSFKIKTKLLTEDLYKKMIKKNVRK